MADLEKNEGSVRGRFRDLDPDSTDVDNKAYARYMSLAPATPLGHAELVVGSNPVELPSIPPEARRVVLNSLDGPVTFTDDGSDPSSSHGMIIPEGSLFVYDSEPSGNFKLWAAISTEVRVAYYG